jgi:hypothetical protein
MTDEERQIGRIKAVLYASEEVVEKAKKVGLKDTIQQAQEIAYEHIKGIIEDAAYCPWQE